MAQDISYSGGTQITSTIALPSTFTTSEVDLAIFLDKAWTPKSQLTIMGAVTLGAVVSATLYYYYTTDSGTTWYPVSLFNTSTGEMTQRAVLVDSGTYALTGVSRFVDNLPLGVCNGFKITGKSSSATPGLTALFVGVRDN